jgi:dinuclear metal center YbgI/SA1388 family protein
MADAQQISDWLDGLLRTSEIPDYPGAVNGLQLASRGDVDKVVCAVDFSSATVAAAVRAGADMLLVHHGMFWGGTQPLTGPIYDRLAALVSNDIAVYSSHLPLDLHPEIGNNVLLARRFGLAPSEGFAEFKGVDIGVCGTSDVTTESLVRGADELATGFRGTVITTPYEKQRLTRRWAICTGAGADSETIREARERAIDTMIVGEGPHHTAVMARDLGIVIIYAGHYATETLGIRALADRAARQFGAAMEFLDEPTGL